MAEEPFVISEVIGSEFQQRQLKPQERFDFDGNALFCRFPCWSAKERSVMLFILFLPYTFFEIMLFGASYLVDSTKLRK